MTSPRPRRSPLAAEAINARPYAFLDDAPLEERRTQAVQSRRYADPKSADDLGRLDADAIDAVRTEAWPRAQDADEMHEALTGIGVVTQEEAVREPQWERLLGELALDGRATCLLLPDSPPAGCAPAQLWVTAERLPQLRAVFPGAGTQPPVAVPQEYAAQPWTCEDALRELVRARLIALGPVSSAQLASSLGLLPADVEVALLGLQHEGFVLQGRFTADAVAAGNADQWCERHLLARIHRYTLRRLRREIEPVERRDFARFLFDWQHISRETRVSGPEALAAILAQLEGYEAPATAWEMEILSARVEDYSTTWLDDLCTAGRTVWTRLRSPAAAEAGRAGGSTSLRSTPLLLLPRKHLSVWTTLAPAADADTGVGPRSERVLAHLQANGAPNWRTRWPSW